MQRLISLKTHTYAQKERTVGEAYDADEQHVKTLCAMGNARVATESEEDKDGQEYLTRDMAAAPRRSRRARTEN